MKVLKVVCAIIKKDEEILIAKRIKGEFKGLWEFPGGKIETNETNIMAIKREIKEEFEVEIVKEKYLFTIEHEYNDFYLDMDCFLCELNNEEIILHDHSEIKWINPYDKQIGFCPADEKVFKLYQDYLNTCCSFSR